MPNKSFHAPTAASVPHVIAIDSQIDALVNHFLSFHFGEISFQFSAIAAKKDSIFSSNLQYNFLPKIIRLLFNVHAMQADFIVCQ